MVVSAYHAQPLPPSGAAHAIALYLTPRHQQHTSAASSSASPYYSHSRGELLCHLVTARDDVVNIYEVRQKASSNATSIASTSSNNDMSDMALYHVRAHHIFGEVTGLARCRIGNDSDRSKAPGTSTAPSQDDAGEVLIVSFADAKIALLQWSASAADLVTISIHTYERVETLSEGLPPRFVQLLRADPESRCAALLLPQDSLAVLPFYNDTAEELDHLLEQAGGNFASDLSLDRSLPYAPSFLLDMRSVDPDIRNIRDFVFLPNFQQPTVAILFEREATWTGRLSERHDTCAVRIITLDLTISSTAQHRVISSKDNLPSDCLFLTACPQSLGGGVLVTTSAAVLYIDQNGRTVGLAVSGWHPLTSKVGLPMWEGATSAKETNGASNGHMNGSQHGEKRQGLDLTGSHVVFPDSEVSSGLLFLSSGKSLQLTCALEGRTVSSLNLRAREHIVIPSLATILPERDGIFVGSMTGPSRLYKLLYQEEAALAATTQSNDTDMELDEDLYGESAMSPSHRVDGSAKVVKRSGEIHLQASFELEALGPVLHICPAIVSDGESARGLSQTAVCSGGAPSGALNLLEPQIVPRSRKQIALAASESLFLIDDNTQTKERVLLLSTDRASELSTIDELGVAQHSVSLKGQTVYGRTVSGERDTLTILRVTTRDIELLSADGKQQQQYALGDDRTNDVDIFKAEYCAGHLTLLWSDGSLNLLRVSSTAIDHVELPAVLQSQKYISAGIFQDRYRSFRRSSRDNAAASTTAESARLAAVPAQPAMTLREDDDEEIDYGDDDVQHVGAESSNADQQEGRSDNAASGDAFGADGQIWLILTTDEACVQIFSIDDLATCVWQSNSLYPAPSRLDYVTTTSEDADVPSLGLSHVQVCYIGDVLHLTAAFENGLLNVFEAVPFAGDDDEVQEAMKDAKGEKLNLSFVKVLARELDIGDVSGVGGSNNTSVSGLSLTPFDSLRGLSGLFVGGASPAWILRSQHGLTHLYMSAEPMTSFDAGPGTSQDGDTFVYAQFGMACIARFPKLDFTFPVAHHKKARTGRTYTKAAPHPFTKTIVAASALPQEFVLFDPEDGHVIEDPADDPSPAHSLRGALELFADDENEPLDGYEFDQCEVVTCVELVTLRSKTSVSGLKDFIAVGTIFSHGEDRPARGATYIFDVAEVVPPPNDPGNRFRLRLLVKDDAKGPITGITDINGYLVVVMGLKLFVRSFEKDEWLITIAFLDTPFLATGLQRLKNFIIMTDVKRGVWLVAFQEDPYRLVVVSKDYDLLHAVTGAFLLQDGDMTITVTSHDGILRLFNYAPNIPASQGGQRLLVRSEYDMVAEASSVMVVPGPPSRDGGISTSSELVYGMVNGAIQTLQPVEDDIFNTLHLLQGQLIRNVQHFAGLNPRGFRAVRNELATRPLSKGVLDGRLLSAFEMLPRPKMEELAKLVPDLVDGSDQLLRYIATLRSSWGVQ